MCPSEVSDVLWLRDCCRDHLNCVGGKNVCLGEMIQAGIRVPPGLAVTTSAYTRFLDKAGLWKEVDGILSTLVLDDIESEDRVSEEIRQLIESTPLPAQVEDAIHSSYLKLAEECNVPNLPVAVRSSATAEDLPGASFAGQQDTYLWVRGSDEVVKHVTKCWSSLFTSRAISYRTRMGFPHDKVLMSVGVQKMVNARAAGVTFTLNPASGDRSKIAIEGNWGLGESVAQGEVTPDEYLVDKVTWQIVKRVVSEKTVEYMVDAANSRVVCQEIPPERRNLSCVSDEEIIEIARLARIIERFYGRPQDIEWAIDRDLPFPDNVVILQSRNETVWSQKQAKPVLQPRASALEHIVDNLIAGKRVNIGGNDVSGGSCPTL
ncbi:MAG: phenylphosphate synthase subunit beta [Chloroflexi bacterium]|nr:phenylphosphate synthase subunit beta [Chloroflexota bacterium]MDA8188221.1 hypothetical protein [Dehalococcoidales bacterium]